MHIIFWLDGSHMTPKELDQFICAELQDKYLSEKDHIEKPMVDGEGKPIHKQDENDEKVINPLWTAVTSFLLHGPCGQYNPSLGCMVDSIVDLDIPRTTKQQQKYQKVVILNIANLKTLTKCTKHSVMTNSMSIQIMMWCHTTNISYSSMIATSM